MADLKSGNVLRGCKLLILIAAAGLATPAQASDSEQTCGYETIGDIYSGGGTYYICRSRDRVGNTTYDHACAFAGEKTWCQGSTKQAAPRLEFVPVDSNAFDPAEQARRAKERAQRGGPKETPLCVGNCR